jgi:hypothetical protein
MMRSQTIDGLAGSLRLGRRKGDGEARIFALGCVVL